MRSRPPPHGTEARPVRGLPHLDDRLWERLRAARRRRGGPHALGRHGAQFAGFAASFTQYRPYVPGDDPRFIDHRLLARCERDYVKMARLESSLACLLLIDATRSMVRGGGGPPPRPRAADKLSWACAAAWIGACLLDRMGDTCGLYVCGHARGPVLPQARGAAHREALRRVLCTLTAGGEGAELAPDLRRASGLARDATLTVILSDFIAPSRALVPALEAMAETRTDLVLVQILDDAERSLPFEGAVCLRDPETGREVRVDADEIRDAYHARVAAQRATLERFAADRPCLILAADPARDSHAAAWETILGGEERQGPW